MAQSGEIETSFSTMPTRLQLDIVKSIQKGDLKSARLASKLWFAMISYVHPPGFKLLKNNNEVLDILKKSYHRTISKLQIGDFTQPLPINSSFRCGIPKTHHLVLSEGNSNENITKLLRYLAKTCKILAFDCECFGKFPSGFWKGIHRYEFLHNLEIQYRIPDNIGPDALHFQKHNHLNVLRQLLEIVRLPGLQKLSIKGVRGPDFLPDVGAELALQTFNRFNEAMDLFLERHGRQLIDVTYLGIPLRLVKSFKYLCNVKNLKFAFQKHLNDQHIQNDAIEGLKYMKKLKSLVYQDMAVMPSYCYMSPTIPLLLNENRKTLNALDLTAFQARPRADYWLPVNSALELKQMRLLFFMLNEVNLLNLTTIMPRKLESVTQLIFHFGFAVDGLGNLNNINWGDQMIPWIIDTLPNLKELALETTHRINDVNRRILIRGLSNLTLMVNEYRVPEPGVDDDVGQVAPEWVTHEPNEVVIVMSRQEPLRAQYYKCTSWIFLRLLRNDNL